jgi:histidine triad (HIT) family protein
MLSEEEAKKIKEKIISHIEQTFSAEQIPNAVNQIKTMNTEQLENFLEKNNLIKTSSGNEISEGKDNECVFCAIASDKIKSVKIGENKKAIAVLEINPISNAHSIVIPREHKDKIPKEALELAKKISRDIQKKFSPKDVKISKSALFGHEVINILPVYSDENFDSKRKSATMEELESIREELERKPIKISKPKTKKIMEFIRLPKRIP